MFITEHESGHGKLVLLVVSEPQYYEFAYFIQCLIRKRQQSLVTHCIRLFRRVVCPFVKGVVNDAVNGSGLLKPFT